MLAVAIIVEAALGLLLIAYMIRSLAQMRG